MTPRSDRFRPSRAGVINVWDYVDEEFVFADGRLVLRGHNGSGKTKALEVLFPFVLDGYTDARRLDPFSGQNRTMKSNLLYRGDDSAYGYVWMEFARPGGERTETATLVIGLRAHKHRDGVNPSFFVTDQRLGVDFGLLASDGRPLTERQLKGVLGDTACHATAADYRRAVDARLFGLGDRYTQLLDLLLALRRPLLAKDLDPDKVSETLTSGLSPLDEALLDQAARDFTNLAAVQRRFDQATTAHAATSAFVGEYASYLTVHARHRLARVREATGQAAEQAGAVTGARDTRQRAALDHAEATESSEELDARVRALDARRSGLEADDAFKSHAALEVERAHSAETARDLREQEARLDAQAGEVGALRREADQVGTGLERLGARAGELAAELAEAADQAGIGHDGEGPADSGDDLPAAAQARAAARRADVDAVRERLRGLAGAETARASAEQAAALADERLRRRDQECGQAADDLAAARGAAADALAAWARTWTQGPSPVTGADCVEALEQALARFGEPGTPALTEVYGEHTDQRRLDAVAHVRTLEERAAQRDEEAARLTRERADIAAERDDAPAADPRRTATREGRPGAPLWRLVRFADTVADDDAAAVEGALDGAGLLTAWVHPDPDATRSALAEGEADAYLLPDADGGEDAGEGAGGGRTLADVLVPEQQDLVPEDVIARVLASVRLSGPGAAPATGPAATGPRDAAPGGARSAAPAAHTVTTGAGFAQGMLVGTRPKDLPEFIGATNRAHRRRERLADCDARLADLAEQAARLSADLDRAGDLLKAFTRARSALPDTTPVERAVRRVEHHSTLLASAREEGDERRRALDAAVAEVDAHRHQVRAVAAERAMPVAPEAVEAVARAVDDFAAAARGLHTAREEVARSTADLDARRETVTRLGGRLEEDRERHEERRREHERAAAELAAREAGISAPVRELMAELERVRESLREARAEHGRVRARVASAHETMIRADRDLEHGHKALSDAFAALFEHADAFSALTHPDLRAALGVAPGPAWPDRRLWPAPERAAEDVLAASRTEAGEAVLAALPTQAVALTDAFAAAVDPGRAVTDSDLKSASTRASNALRAFQDALGGDAEGYRVDHDFGTSGIITVFVNDETGRNPVSAFARVIADRVEDQGALLREEERGVLEDELLSGIAQQIHERVRVARDLVSGMDRDTRSRPMSSGTRIGIRWSRSDRLSEDQAVAAGLLKRDAAGLGHAGLTRLREVLRQMIRAHHAAHPRATYKQVLAAVLDYRTWYRFELRMAVPGQDEVRLTKNKHEQMSGGEKSAAIHLPLFAAANALYTSAAPTCPRMIALDEAFAGIDDRYKPELMGLTVTFDLDMFMTGHDLWVHYDSVPMAAHYDMHHDKGSHTVSSLFMLWDGAQTIDADAGFSGNEELAAALLGFTPSRFAPLSAAGTLLEDVGD